MKILTLIFCLLSILQLSAQTQWAGFVGTIDTKNEKGFLLAGVSASFDDAENTKVVIRSFVSKRQKEIDNEVVTSEYFNLSALYRVFIPINEETRLFVHAGIGGDGMLNQDDFSNQVSFPIGFGVSFDNVNVYTEKSFSKGEFVSTSVILAYKF